MRKTLSLLLTAAMIMNILAVAGFSLPAGQNELVIAGFDTDGDFSEWEVARTSKRYLDGSNATVADGFFNAKVKDQTNSVTIKTNSAATLSVDTDEYDVVAVDMSYSGFAADAKVTMEFTTASGSKTIEAFLGESSGTSSTVINFAVAAEGTWSGVVTAMTLSITTDGGEFKIDSIKAIKAARDKTLTYKTGSDEDDVTGMPAQNTDLYKTGDVVVLSTAIPSREGYKFLGWAVEGTNVPVTQITFGETSVAVVALWGEVVYEYEFATDDDFMGFTMQNASAVVSGHKLIGSTQVGAKVVAEDVGIDTSIYSKLEIGMAYSDLDNASQATKPAVYVKSTGNSEFNAISAEEMLIYITSPDTQVLNFDISGNGVLDEFQFAPFPGVGNFVIDYIRFIKPGQEPERVTLTFNGNGSTVGVVPSSVSLAPGELYVLPKATQIQRAGYHFSGWSVDPAADFTGAVDSYELSVDTTLYAIWSKESKDGVVAAVTPASGSVVNRLGTVLEYRFNSDMNVKTLTPENFSSQYVSKVVYNPSLKIAYLYLKSDAFYYGNTIRFTPSKSILAENSAPFTADEYVLTFNPYVADVNANFVANGDFEDQNELGVYVEGALGSVISEDHNSFYKVEQGGELKANIPLKPNTTYSVSFKAKSESTQAQLLPALNYSQADSTVCQAIAIDAQGYTVYSKTVTTGAAANASSWLSIACDTDTNWFIDDLFIAEVVTVKFEAGIDITGTAPAGFDGIYSVGSTITLPDNTFAKQDYTFTGWTDGVNNYAPGDSYTLNKTVVFTPVFTTNKTQYTVVFDYTKSLSADGEQSIAYVAAQGSDVIFPEDPTLDGASFIGWGYSVDDTQGVSQATVNENLTFYALWDTLDSWEFNTDNDIEGWVANGNGFDSIAVTGGALTGSAKGPVIADKLSNSTLTNSGIFLDTSDYGTVEIVMEITPITLPDGESIQTIVEYTNDSGEKEKVSAELDNVQGAQTLVFDMYQTAYWRGNIVSLTVYPAETYVRRLGASFKIDSIKVSPIKPMVVYDLNDANATGGPEAAADLTEGQQYTLSSEVPVLKHAEFLGWSLDRTGQTGLITSITVPAGITRVYAIWEREEVLTWEFDTDNNNEGWVADTAYISSATVGDGVYSLLCNKLYSGAYRPSITISNLSLIAGNYSRVIVSARYENCRDITKSARLFFTTTADSSASPYIVGDPIVKDGKFHEYVFYVQNNDLWAEGITQLSFMPFVQTERPLSGVNYICEVDYIRLIPNQDIAGDPQISIVAPATYTTPAQARVLNSSCKSATVQWVGALENGMFAPETVYSAKVVIKPYQGYLFDGSQTVYVNGKETEYTITSEGNITFEVTFPKTSRPPVFGLELTSDQLKDGFVTIGVDSGKAVVKTKFTGEIVPDKSVVWSISNTQIANIDENGIVRAKNNGVAIVKATSVFDSSIYADIPVLVSGQTAAFTLTYLSEDPAATNMPVPDTAAKGITALSKQIPSSPNAVFAGWSLYPDGPLVTSVDVQYDTVVYAKWVTPIKAFEFNTDGDAEGIVAEAENPETISDGALYSFMARGDSRIHYRTPFDPTNVDYIEIGIQSTIAGRTNLYFGVDGAAIAEATRVDGTISGTINPIGSSLGYTVITYPVGAHPKWRSGTNITQVSFTPMDGAVGARYAIDYIRFYSADKKLTYFANAGTDTVTGMPQPVPFITATYIELADTAPVRSGYKFLGWSLEPNSKDYITDGTFSENTSVYANWEIDWARQQWTDGNSLPVAYTQEGEWHVADDVAAPALISDNLATYNFAGSKYGIVKFNLRGTVTTADDRIKGKIYFKTTEDTDFTEENSAEFDSRVGSTASKKITFQVDMSNMNAWYNGTITQVKIVPYANGTGEFYLSDLEFVVGGRGNGMGEGAYTTSRDYTSGNPTSMRKSHFVDFLPGIYPTDIRSGEYGWDFNEKTNAEGWNAIMDMKLLSVGTGNAYLRSTGKDPVFNSPKFSLSASQYRYVVVGLQYALEKPSSFQLFFTTNTVGLSEAASLSVSLPHKYSNGFVDIVFDMSRNELWQGTIRQLRLDIGVCPGEHAVKYVKLCENLPNNLKPDDKEGKAPVKTEQKVEFTKQTEWDFEQSTSAEGWKNDGCESETPTLKNGFIGGVSKPNSSGNFDPMLYSPEVKIDAAAHKYMAVGMKNSGSRDGSSFNMLFITQDDKTWDAAKSAAAVKKVKANNDRVVEYVFNLSDIKAWSGVVTQFRLEPFDSAGTFEIDYIKLLDKIDINLGDEMLNNGNASDADNVAFVSGSTIANVTIQNDQADQTNNIYSVKTASSVSNYNYFKQNVEFEPNSRYIFEFDLRVDNLAGGSTDIASAVFGVNAVYADESSSDHVVKSITATRGQWTHFSIDFTTGFGNGDRSKDQMALYCNPTNGLAVDFSVDNLTLRKVIE